MRQHTDMFAEFSHVSWLVSQLWILPSFYSHTFQLLFPTSVCGVLVFGRALPSAPPASSCLPPPPPHTQLTHHTQLSHTHNLLTHNSHTQSHTTYSHTTLTHTQLTYNLLTHHSDTYNLLTNTHNSPRLLPHTHHTHTNTHTILSRVALGDIDLHL